MRNEVIATIVIIGAIAVIETIETIGAIDE